MKRGYNVKKFPPQIEKNEMDGISTNYEKKQLNIYMMWPKKN